MGNNSSSSSAKKQKKSSFFRRKKKNDSNVEEDDHDWVLECVIEYVQSPECAVFVDGFIDENCLVFDPNDNNEDVSGFEHRQLHVQYKNMVETLLLTRLGKMGITAQQFTDACQKGNKQRLNSTMLHYIAAIDDFKAFKYIMVQRNIQLEKQAVLYLTQQQQQNQQATIAQQAAKASVAPKPAAKANDANKPMSEQEQIEWALAESLRQQSLDASKRHEKLMQEQQKLEHQQIQRVSQQIPAVHQPQIQHVQPQIPAMNQPNTIPPSAPAWSRESSAAYPNLGSPKNIHNANNPSKLNNNNFNNDIISNPFEEIANIDMLQPNKPALKPLKPLNALKALNVQHNDNPFREPMMSNDELQPLTAESIQNIKQKQADSSILKQKQMILDMRKQKRNREIESFQPGAPNWMEHLNKMGDESNANESALPPLSKSLFAKMTEDKDYTFQ